MSQSRDNVISFAEARKKEEMFRTIERAKRALSGHLEDQVEAYAALEDCQDNEESLKLLSELNRLLINPHISRSSQWKPEADEIYKRIKSASSNKPLKKRTYSGSSEDLHLSTAASAGYRQFRMTPERIRRSGESLHSNQLHADIDALENLDSASVQQILKKKK